MFFKITLLSFLPFLSPNNGVVTTSSALSTSNTESLRSKMARSRLSEAFRSPSKKLTLHPELILPEPSDPTALMLRTAGVTQLSSKMRVRAKANGLIVDGTVDAIMPLGKEQEQARGNFPGPIPIIYSLKKSSYHSEGNEMADTLERLSQVEGVEGVLVPFFEGNQIENVKHYMEQVENDPFLKNVCKDILAVGMQPIPEIVLESESIWDEEEVIRLIDAVKETCGGLDPVAIVFSNGEVEASEDNEMDKSSTPNITIPKSFSHRLSFLGSIRTTAGAGRINNAISQLFDRNFNGAFLRANCVPGYRLNPDLAAVGDFWSAALGDLKSLKSKNFSFRSKVKLDKDMPMEWYNYQKSVMDSGALGMSGGSGGSDGLNTDGGDYMGF